MKKELFESYKQVLLRIISFCTNTDQLTCCADMMDRYNEQFKFSIEPKELALAMDELSSLFLQKQHELSG